MSKIAVIGRGLIGSAAARHLAKSGNDVTLIGPDEPADLSNHDGVFASHYDEGRITRKLATHSFWSEVSSASIERYSEIEQESGLKFFSEVGAIMAGPAKSSFATNIHKVCKNGSIASDVYSGTELPAKFPCFNFPSDTTAFHEPQNAGHISPRKLVAAQTRAAQHHGATILNAVVRAIRQSGEVEIANREQPVQFDQVLIAAGAFTNALLNKPLGLTSYARTIAFFEVDAAEAARLENMPSLVYRYADGRDPYLLPPILYPDGKTYLKLGGDPVDRILKAPHEIKDWFRTGGNPKVGEYLQNVIRELMPDLRITSQKIGACVTMFTSHGLPYIDRLTDKICVATGGCGAGAKCSDELGRLGAQAVLGNTDPQLKAIFKGS